MNSSYTALHTSRGIQSHQHKLFMRISVIAADLLGTKNILHRYQCCGSGMFILVPGSEFFSIPDSGSFSIPDPGSASKNLSILTQKIVSKLSEIQSGLFIPDPDPDFYSSQIPDPGVKKAPDPPHWLVSWIPRQNGRECH
jgi:hypothetical protein